MDTPSVRAKFGCTAVEAVDDGFRIKLDAVVAGSDENESFFKLTPYGHIEMAVVSEDTAKLFIKGHLYFVDFTPAVVVVDDEDAPAADEPVAPDVAPPADVPEDAAPAPDQGVAPSQPAGGDDVPPAQE